MPAVYRGRLASSVPTPGLSAEPVDAVVLEYAEAQIVALKAAFAVVVLAALAALLYVRHLPDRAGTGDEADVAALGAEAS